MAYLLAYSSTLRQTRITSLLTALDQSTGAGVLKIYSDNPGRPATGGAASGLLATLPLGTTSGTKPSGTVSGAVLTILTNGATGVQATGSGTASWARLEASNGTFVADMNVGTSGTDIVLNSVSITSGQTVSITSGGTITEGNA